MTAPCAAGSRGSRGERRADDGRRHRAPGRRGRVEMTARGLRCTALLAAVLATGACSNTVRPPAPGPEPRVAVLLDHGRHASLVIERADGITRYAYGQWAWYVENRTGPLRASGMLFGPSEAGLGRRHLPGPATLAAVRRQVRVPIEAAWRLEVPPSRAEALARELEGIFRAHAATRTRNPLYDLEFVHHPEPYGIGHNSNHMTAEWLRALGCEVDMGGPFSIWSVERAAPGS